MEEKQLYKLLSYFNRDLIDEILEESDSLTFPHNTQLVRAGQYIKSIPIVLKGLIKVFISHEDKDLLLYYIKPGESCIMLFSAILNNQPSKVYAVTDEETTLISIQAPKLLQWIKKYPDLNTLFFKEYNMRYNDMLQTIHSVIFENMDVRLYKYLTAKAMVMDSDMVSLSHKQIANDLGTAREVISRILKRLETEKKIIQLPNGIKIL